LQEALRVALGLVLDHFYSKRGGYTLSPSEKRRNATLVLGGDKNNKGGTPPLSPDSVFQQRRQRLLTMLMPPRKKQQQREDRRQRQRVNDTNTGPPFTIQRIAEVLVSPERVSTVQMIGNAYLHGSGCVVLLLGYCCLLTYIILSFVNL
jgi:hypothetical protein